MKLRPGMTATVYIISGEAKNVLRIPNAALRFTPNLPAEEMQNIIKEAGEKMMARRPQEGGAGNRPRSRAGPSGPGGGARQQPGAKERTAVHGVPAKDREPRRPRGRG